MIACYGGVRTGLIFRLLDRRVCRAGRAGYATVGDLIEDSSSYCLQEIEIERQREKQPGVEL